MKRKLFVSKKIQINIWKMLLLLILSLLIILFFVFLPFFVQANSSLGLGSEFIIDLQIGNRVAILNLPPKLTEFNKREVVRIELSEAPFISKNVAFMAIRDLEKLFPAQIKWCSKNRNIKIVIPEGIISKTTKIVTLSDKDYLLKNNRAFVSIRKIATLLQVSEIIWFLETQGTRLIWDYN